MKISMATEENVFLTCCKWNSGRCPSTCWAAGRSPRRRRTASLARRRCRARRRWPPPPRAAPPAALEATPGSPTTLLFEAHRFGLGRLTRCPPCLTGSNANVRFRSWSSSLDPWWIRLVGAVDCALRSDVCISQGKIKKTVGIGIIIRKTVAVGTRFFHIYETNKIKYGEKRL